MKQASRFFTSGFTLIEVMVAVGISLAVMAGVVINYNAYNDSQIVKQTALTLKNHFRFSQSKALSGDKPAGCVQLVGWRVTFAATNYVVQADCTNGLDTSDVTTEQLPAGVRFVPLPSSITFRPLTKGTSLTAIETITLMGVVRSYQLQVSPNGDINDVGFVGQ